MVHNNANEITEDVRPGNPPECWLPFRRIAPLFVRLTEEFPSRFAIRHLLRSRSVLTSDNAIGIVMLIQPCGCVDEVCPYRILHELFDY